MWNSIAFTCQQLTWFWKTAVISFFSLKFRYDEDGRESLDPVDQDLSDDDPEAYVTNLSYYHLVPFETDILDWLFLQKVYRNSTCMQMPCSDAYAAEAFITTGWPNAEKTTSTTSCGCFYSDWLVWAHSDTVITHVPQCLTRSCCWSKNNRNNLNI